MDSRRRYLFKDELDRIADRSAVSIDYLDSRDQLYRELDRLADAYRKDGSIMIAGPQSMVNPLAAELRNRKIPKRNIVKDAFFGYYSEETEGKIRWRSPHEARIGRKPRRFRPRILPVRRTFKFLVMRANAGAAGIRPLSSALAEARCLCRKKNSRRLPNMTNS